MDGCEPLLHNFSHLQFDGQGMAIFKDLSKTIAYIFSCLSLVYWSKQIILQNLISVSLKYFSEIELLFFSSMMLCMDASDKSRAVLAVRYALDLPV